MGDMDEVEQLELAVGPLRFDARAAGPADGPVVLLLHGFPETSASWRHQLGALGAAGYRVVAPDQRGYSPGARPSGIEAYDPERLVEDTIGFADALGADRVHLVGHDFGGLVAWHTASRHADRLLTLTVASTPHPRAVARSILEGGEQRERSSYMLFFRSDAAEGWFLDDDAAGLRRALTGVDAEDAVRVLTQPGAMTAALNWYRALNRGVIERMGEISTPTMYVWSTDDPALGQVAAEETASLVAGPYRFEVLDGVDHWVPEHAADRFNGLLLDHLAGD